MARTPEIWDAMALSNGPLRAGAPTSTRQQTLGSIHPVRSEDSMKTHRFWCKFTMLFLLTHLAAGGTSVRAEDYPIRQVKIISDSAPGSAVDVTLRVIADRLSQAWRQQV